MYKKIMNPLTNKKVNIYSKLGKQIIRNYLRIFNGGGTVKEEALFNTDDIVEIHNLSNDISPDNLKHVGKQGIILSLMEAHAGLNSTLYYNVTLPDGSKLDIRPNNVRKVEVDYDSSPIPPVLERERRPYGME